MAKKWKKSGIKYKFKTPGQCIVYYLAFLSEILECQTMSWKQKKYQASKQFGLPITKA